MESQKNFETRCAEVSGVAFALIPRRAMRPGDTPPGKSLAKRGDWWLFAVGYPDGEDVDGCEVWDPRPENFLIVCLHEEADLLIKIEAEEDAEALLRLAVEASDWGWAKAHALALAKAIEKA